MAYDESLALRIRSILAGDPAVTERKMFGGLAFLHHGLMFLGVSGDKLMARVGKDAHAQALGRAHVRKMDFTGKPMQGYVYVEPAGLHGDARLRSWLQQCKAFVETLPPRSRPAKRATTMMKKSIPAADPDAYVASLEGWQRSYVQALRATLLSTAPLQETIKWGHLVYFAGGPALLLRAEERRVLFGLWRGQRLRGIEPRLKPGGKYEMATLELKESTPLERSTVVELVKQAVALNTALGDPTSMPSP